MRRNAFTLERHTARCAGRTHNGVNRTAFEFAALCDIKNAISLEKSVA